MSDFFSSLLSSKSVAVWGTGYLGYTTMIRLQAHGFRSLVWDANQRRLDDLASGAYPMDLHRHNWSHANTIPDLDLAAVALCPGGDPAPMFDSRVHLVSFSGKNLEDPKANRIRRLAEVFIANRDRLGDCLVVFQSAEAPGNIDENFLAPLAAAGVSVDCVSAFRGDWTIERFLTPGNGKTLAATSEAAMQKARFFYGLLDVAVEEMPSIRDCEIFECARDTLQYVADAYLAQLALAYPDADMGRLSRRIARSVRLGDAELRIGGGGTRMLSSVDSLLQGAAHPDQLTLVREAQMSNGGVILKYADYILKKGYRSVTVMGLSSMRNIKLAEISPAVTLADYLLRNGLTVRLDDPFYDRQEISAILPRAEVADVLAEGLGSEVLFVMADYSRYKFLNQRDIERTGIARAKLILDNTGLFRPFRFSAGTVYHAVGDGKLDIQDMDD